MNIKLHNKFEVSCGADHFVAYNTMLYTVYEKIKNLEPYNSVFAFGTGTAEVGVDGNKLGSFVASFPTTTEQIQPDCKSGEMFVVKSKVFGENEANGMVFSEIGLTDTMESDPVIFNHVVLTNDDGEVVSVTKRAGKEMVIKLTIYLEVSQTSNAKLVGGDNLLVKQLLGEDVLQARTLAFTKGINNQPNVEIYREAPREIVAAEFERIDYYQAQFAGVGIKYSCDFGQNVVREIVVLADGVPVIRYNCMAEREPIVMTETLTKATNNCVDLGDDVKVVLGLTNEDGTENIDYVLNSYAHSFGDYIAQPFDMPFDKDTTRFVAKDGSMIAFVLNGSIYIYKNSNLLIDKVDTSAVSAQNIEKILMIDGFVFIKMTASPFLKAYQVVDNVCQELAISLGDESYSFDLTGMDITQSFDEKIRIAGIDSDLRGVCYLGEVSEGVLSIDTKLVTSVANIEKALCLYKNNYCDSEVYFLTTNANNTGFPAVIIVDSAGTMSISSDKGPLAILLIQNTYMAFGTNRLLCCKKASVQGSAILNTYFFPEGLRYNVPFDGEEEIYCSPDFKYVIKKYSNTSYKIYSIIGLNTPREFDDGVFEQMAQSEFSDFVFLKDSLLIFTTNSERPIIAINLNLTSGTLEGLASTAPETVVAEFQKYDPLGARTGEYVEAKLTFTVGGAGE